MQFDFEGDDFVGRDIVRDLPRFVPIGFAFAIQEHGILRAFLGSAEAHQDRNQLLAGFIGILGFHQFVVAPIDQRPPPAFFPEVQFEGDFIKGDVVFDLFFGNRQPLQVAAFPWGRSSPESAPRHR